MQQTSAKSDEESIDLAILNYFEPATRAVAEAHEKDVVIDREAFTAEVLDRCVNSFTEDPQFRGLVSGLYYSLSTDPEWLKVISR